MSLYYQDDHVSLYHGDCIEVMRSIPAESVDSIVTDPPYGLGFMGKKWDELPPGEEWARECLRVLKPGGHILAFGGSRTWHRLAVAIEDAGFEIRDGVLWLYGSGFPKSHDVSKAIDKIAGAEREVIGANPNHRAESGVAYEGVYAGGNTGSSTITAPATPEAAQWDGWGTALKPAFEPIVLARKPLAEKTVARNVLVHGTGAINIDACRIGMSDEERVIVNNRSGSDDGKRDGIYSDGVGKREPGQKFTAAPAGRWPANVLLDEHTAELLDEQSGELPKSGGARRRGAKSDGVTGWKSAGGPASTDSGGASRFFYVAKAPKRERPNVDGIAHPTVKPLALMRWLCKLVTPEHGTILDTFAGSGTTIEAALIEGYNVIGIERETEYLPLIQHRINRANGGKS